DGIRDDLVTGVQTCALPISPRRPRSGLGHLLRLRFPPHARLTDELFAALAAANPDLRLERTARGVLEVMAPAGGGSSNRNSELRSEERRVGKESRVGWSLGH